MEFECGFEWEPLRTPLGFKGGSLTGLWQTAVWLRGAGGCGGLGLGTQSTLWSDPELFASCSEEEGNRRMYAITREALARARALDFASPPALLDALLPALDAYAREVTGRPDLRLTFILNALVALDNAAWQLVAAEQGWRTFDDLIPEAARPALSCRHRELALIPLISYGMSPAAALAEVEQGAAVLKIKLGHDPAGDGDPEKMLAWDCRRL
ncbi:MAG: L-alanine-DL-glutamate epimerase, partial [Candidatus Marinimicrobia bacterium]|nr:L-alanine-DL-glutamate epimerase [Candidatus Neomarinimicrobiota bacterium]